MLIKIGRDIPLIGNIAFGIIDRGTSLIQIRPTSVCNLNCTFCSVDSGKHSKWHPHFYEVDLNYLLEEIEKVIRQKGTETEINIDSVGEVLSYPYIEELTKGLRKINNVKKISLQTNGTILKELDIDVMNISLHTLDEEQGKELANCPYSVKRILEFIEHFKDKTKIRICPVWIPNVNDKEMPKIIQFAKENNYELGIQKYEVYKYSRKIPKAKVINWWKFYKQLEDWEKEFDVKLKLSANDLGIKRTKKLPLGFKKGEKVYAKIKCPGWMQGQMIGTSKNYSISINNCDKKPGDIVPVKILENKNNIYLAE